MKGVIMKCHDFTIFNSNSNHFVYCKRCGAISYGSNCGDIDTWLGVQKKLREY